MFNNDDESNTKNIVICPDCFFNGRKSTLTDSIELSPRAKDECSKIINICYNCGLKHVIY